MTKFSEKDQRSFDDSVIENSINWLSENRADLRKTLKEWRATIKPSSFKFLREVHFQDPNLYDNLIISLIKNGCYTDESVLMTQKEYVRSFFRMKILIQIKKCFRAIKNISFFTINNQLIEYEIETFEALPNSQKKEQIFIFGKFISAYINSKQYCFRCTLNSSIELRPYTEAETAAIDAFLQKLYIPTKYFDPITNEIMSSPVILPIPLAINLTQKDVVTLANLHKKGELGSISDYILTYKPDFLTSSSSNGSFTKLTVNESTYRSYFSSSSESQNQYNLRFEFSSSPDDTLINDLKHLLRFLGFESEDNYIDPVTLCMITDPVCCNRKPPYYNYKTVNELLPEETISDRFRQHQIRDPVTRLLQSPTDYKRDAVFARKLRIFKEKCNKFGHLGNFMH